MVHHITGKAASVATPHAFCPLIISMYPQLPQVLP